MAPRSAGDPVSRSALLAGWSGHFSSSSHSHSITMSVPLPLDSCALARSARVQLQRAGFQYAQDVIPLAPSQLAQGQSIRIAAAATAAAADEGQPHTSSGTTMLLADDCAQHSLLAVMQCCSYDAAPDCRRQSCRSRRWPRWPYSNSCARPQPTRPALMASPSRRRRATAQAQVRRQLQRLVLVLWLRRPRQRHRRAAECRWARR